MLLIIATKGQSSKHGYIHNTFRRLIGTLFIISFLKMIIEQSNV